MLEGYKLIDFGNMFQAQPGLGQMRNRVGLSQAAANILANSQWTNTPIATLLESGLTVRGEAPKRKQTLWGRVVDLLSMPMYTVANAADDALAGHQSSSNDSVLNDTKEVLGGLFSGAGRGIGTSLRGTFAGSETAADPQDKHTLGRFLQRWDLGMSPEDAVKPENREKVRARLKELSTGDRIAGGDLVAGVPIIGGWLGFADSRPDDDGNISDADIDEYFKDVELQGLLTSIGTDPLNLVGFPGTASKLTKGAKGTAEVPELIKGGFKAPPTTGIVPNTKVNIAPLATGKKPGSYRVMLPPGAVQNKVANPATGELIGGVPSWFDEAFPSSISAMGRSIPDAIAPGTDWLTGAPLLNQVDPLDDILGSWASGRGNKVSDFKAKPAAPVAKVPDAQMRLAEMLSKPEQVTKLTSDLLRRAVTGGPEISKNLFNRLSMKFPGAKFPQTTKLIEHISKIPDFAKRLNHPGERQKIVGAFNRTISADAQAMKIATPIKTAEEIVNQADPNTLGALVYGAKPRPPASKNPVRDAKVAQEVYDKFTNQILGKGRPAGIKNPAAYDAAVAAGKTARYSGSQQVQMWNQITHVMKNVKTPNRFAVANNILRQVEDMFMVKGANPMSGYRVKDSVPLRLSQVLDAIGPAAAAMNPTLLTKILRGDPNALSNLDAATLQKIEELKAGEALVDASKVVKGVDAASKSIEDLIKGPLSVGRQEEIVTIGSRVADDIARMAGGSPVAGSKASSAVKNAFIPKAPGDGFSVTNTIAMISHPDVSGNLLKNLSSAPAVAKAINGVIGGPTPRQLGKLSGPSARAVEWLGARFNAAYKNADMHPIYLRNAASARATVARRAKYLNNLAKTYNVNDADLWNDALKGAQGHMAPPPGSQAEALSQEILQIMENMFGSSGLKASVALENSVAGRSQLFMKELNENLHRFGLGSYQFTKKGDAYKDGTNWLNSWESWKIERPLEFLFKMQNVVEYTVREKNMFDEIIARFGTYNRGGQHTHKVNNHPRLAGVYFGKEGASQVTQFVKNLKDISQPSSKAMQSFDKALSKWKAAVTIYVPFHHIRNMIGDLYFNWLGGVNNPKVYSTALRVMQSQKGRYEGLAEMGNLTSPDALKKAIATGRTPEAVGKQTALTMKNGTNVTNDMVYISAFQQGILPTTRVLEDIPDDVAMGLDKIRPLGGRGQKAAHRISEGRDHYVRLAHYIDQLKKSHKPFEQAVEEAAGVVRKWHPDGMDLTKFERNVMRRMFPFYSWTRKAFPLIVESILASPGKVMAYPKAQYVAQNMMGIDTGPMSDPFPYDQLFPDWIREKGIGPLWGETGSYTVLNPSNPSMDLISQLNNPGKMAMGMVNPAARIPVELATGREAQTGAPIDGNVMGYDSDYLIKQVPGLSHAGRITGEFGVSDTTKEMSSGYNLQNIFNLLTAMGMQNTGPYIKSAEFDLREFLRSQR